MPDLSAPHYRLRSLESSTVRTAMITELAAQEPMISYLMMRRRGHSGGSAAVCAGGMPVDDLPMTTAAKAKSPDGYEWGYGGSGPAALAESMLFHALGEPDDVEACPFWQPMVQAFKWRCIANRTDDTWSIGRPDVVAWALDWIAKNVPPTPTN